MSSTTRLLLSLADRLEPDAVRMLRDITGFAELPLEEVRTAETLSGFLEGRGFRVVRGIAGMKSAFRAEYVFGKGKPAIAFLCEMDALPGLGHACGHNIVGVASACAAAAIAEFGQGRFGSGRVIALGTPAEETGYGKAKLIEAGCFKGIDAAMMVHPSSRRHVAKGYLALHRVHFTYHGRASHAAAYPEHGVNALDAVLLLFQAIGMLRQQLKDTVRIHGIITDGGKAPNIIPERAQAYFYVRGENDRDLAEAVAKVMACAEGAAKSTGCRLEAQPGAYTLSAMAANPVIAASYRRALARLGLPESDAPTDKNRGSSDIGNVSRVVPTLQPNMPISNGERVEIHTRPFEKATCSAAGIAGMMEGIRAMSLTAADLFVSPDLVKAAWAAFRVRPRGGLPVSKL